MSKNIAIFMILIFIFSCNNTTENKYEQKNKQFNREYFLDNIENYVNNAIENFDLLDTLVLNRDIDKQEKTVEQISIYLDSVFNIFDTLYVSEADSDIYNAAFAEIKTMRQVLEKNYKILFDLMQQTNPDTIKIKSLFIEAENKIYTADSLFTIEFSKYVKKYKILRI